MTARFHWFSHIANLKTGSLVLGDPFATPRTEGSICCYALHQADAGLLVPDPERRGLAAWHALLPFERDAPWSDEPLFAIEPYAHRLADEIGTLHEVHFHLELATACARMVPHAPGTDLATWSNPFRLEAYKALGLALRHGFHQPLLTLLVDDPCGELALGLILAAGTYRQLAPGQPPFRIVLVQVRPHDQLTRVFEGASPLDTDDPVFPRPPEPVPGMIAGGLATHLGTAIALDPEEAGDDPFTIALEKLVRSQFVDEEDAVFLLTAPERLKAS